MPGAIMRSEGEKRRQKLYRKRKRRRQWLIENHPERGYVFEQRLCIDCGTQFTAVHDDYIRCTPCHKRHKGYTN